MRSLRRFFVASGALPTRSATTQSMPSWTSDTQRTCSVRISHSPAHSLTHSLALLLTHSLTIARTHALAHSIYPSSRLVCINRRISVQRLRGPPGRSHKHRASTWRHRCWCLLIRCAPSVVGILLVVVLPNLSCLSPSTHPSIHPPVRPSTHHHSFTIHSLCVRSSGRCTRGCCSLDSVLREGLNGVFRAISI
jgi:hypothetical protein